MSGSRSKPAASAVRSMAIGALLGFGLMYVGILLGRQLGHGLPRLADLGFELDAAQRLAAVMVCILATMAAVVAHELGHLLGGWAVGFRAFLLVLGPLRFERGADGWSVGLNRSLALAGGLAGTAPLEDRALRIRTAVMVAGGPVASWVLGLSALAGATLLWRGAVADGLSFGGFVALAALAAFGACSVLIGIATLVPGRTAGYATDGGRLLTLWRGGAAADRDAAMGALVGLSLGGVRPRDLPAELIRKVCVEVDDSGYEAVGWAMAQSRAADLGDAAEARRWLDLMAGSFDRLPDLVQSALRYEVARQYALLGEPALARAMLDSTAGPAIGAPHLAPLATATVLVAEGRDAEARPLLAEARAALGASIDRGSAAWMSESIDALERRIGSRGAPPAAGVGP